MKIGNQADLKLIAGTLHDARFTADAISHDKAAGTFTLKCWVMVPKQKQFKGSVLAQFAQDKIDSARIQKHGGFKAFGAFFVRVLGCLGWRSARGTAIEGARPWRACQLSFTNVEGGNVNIKEKVGYYELATIRFSECDHKLQLATHCGIEISLIVRELNGALTETEETCARWN